MKIMKMASERVKTQPNQDKRSVSEDGQHVVLVTLTLTVDVDDFYHEVPS